MKAMSQRRLAAFSFINFKIMSMLVKIKYERRADHYTVMIKHGCLHMSGKWARDILPTKATKVALVSNEKVFSLYGESLIESFESAGFRVFVWLMKDGEAYKNLESLNELLNYFGREKINRTDTVVSFGGGVVGDLAGFASSIYLRGVNFLQIPTTLLAMIDSSVGGKTGINTGFGKNMVGAFYQPRGVLIDPVTLKTLGQRELTAGFCEAIKQGAVGSQELFDNVANYLRDFPPSFFVANFGKDEFISRLEDLLIRQISFKLKVVTQDESEDVYRDDEMSRKILNFGHTVAHALEKVTNYSYFKHGEAVGYGMLVAAEVSKKLKLLDKNSLEMLREVTASVGELPRTESIEADQVMGAFLQDKKNLGESLQWVLLENIGKPKIIRNQDIPQSIIKESLTEVLAKHLINLAK